MNSRKRKRKENKYYKTVTKAITAKNNKKAERKGKKSDAIRNRAKKSTRK